MPSMEAVPLFRMVNVLSIPKLEVGSKSYCTDVYVAPIDDDMLLVLDFLKRHQTITDQKNNLLLQTTGMRSMEAVPVFRMVNVLSIPPTIDSLLIPP
jgi:hypothetical protein